jgi:hypothetical protein
MKVSSQLHAPVALASGKVSPIPLSAWLSGSQSQTQNFIRQLLELKDIRTDNIKLNLTEVDWTHQGMIQGQDPLGYKAVSSVESQWKFHHILLRRFLGRL